MRQAVCYLGCLFFFALSLIFSSCSQDEGFGGNSHIKGNIVERVYDKDFTVLQYEQPAKKMDVFLCFGNKSEVGADMETSYSGDFSFEYLWPGSYKLFYYTADSANFGLDGESVIKIDLGKGETIDLGTLYCYSTLDWDEGTASIKGYVSVTNYKTNGQIKDVTLAQEQEVYLLYGDDPMPVERIRTSYDGVFEFKNLLKGNYQVFVLSEDISGGTASESIIKSTTITEDGQVSDLGEFNINKL